MLKSKKILLDTNFLLIPGQFGVDIFEELKKSFGDEIELEVLENSLKELEKVAKTAKGADKDAIKLALALIKNINIIKTDKNNHVDDIIVDMADRWFAVCTQDIGLRKRLETIGKKVIILRQKKYLQIRG